MKFIKYFFIGSIYATLLFCLGISVYAQNPTQQIFKDSINKESGFKTDTNLLKTDTLLKKSKSSSALDSEVKYNSFDSIRFDRTNNIVHLYGKGRVIYQDFQLDADYIRLDQKNNTVFARGYTNPKTNRYRGKPIFKQGTEPPLTTDSLFFNYKTKKGKSYGVFSDVEGGYLQANQFKKNEFDEGSFKNGIYSTCNLPHPHFGIHITRGLVTKKQIITGPAYLEIEDVPLPIGIPFGFFPKVNKRASGIIFPTFGEDANLGFYMQNLGYYLGLNDYWDMELMGSLYTKGTYLLSNSVRYSKNYKYDGNFRFAYSSNKSPTGIEGTFSNKAAKDFKINWTHSKDPASSPGSTFSASVNAGTSRYAQNSRATGTYDKNELTRNTLSSSISYTKTFSIFNLSTSLNHNQNLQLKTIALTLPQFSLSMTSINPFDSKNRVGEQKWYQKINVGYSADGSNSINTADSLLFKKESLKNFQSNVRHNIPISLSLNVLKFFQLTSNITYNESWYLQTISKRFGAIPSGNGTVIDTVSGFARAYAYSLGSGLSTKFFGIKNFKKGKLQALRHVATPRVGFSYSPDFTSDKFGFYRDVPRDLIGNKDRYPIFPSYSGNAKQASITFGIENNIEAKMRSKSDTVKKSEIIPIIQGLTFNGTYDLARDSFQLSTIGFSGRTAFFKQKLGINFGGSLDPYQINEQGRQVNKFAIQEGKIARLTNLFLSTDFSLNSNAIKSRNSQIGEMEDNLPNASPQQKRELESISRNPNAFVDFNIPWDISARYGFNYSKSGLESSITNTIDFNGSFNVTPKWKVTFNSGFDFQTAKLTLPQFAIYRDLHCWDLSFNWIPVGQNKSYGVNLKVKASILQDLKLSRRSGSNYNNF